MPSREAAETRRAVALLVGANVRDLRIRRKLTQGQLAAGSFSASYISAVERGKRHPSLAALSFLARRLGVPPSLLLVGVESGSLPGETRPGPQADGSDTHMIGVTLLLGEVLLARRAFGQTLELLAPLSEHAMTYEQLYALHMLRGRVHLERHDYLQAEGSFHSALGQAEGLQERELAERARNLLGLVYFLVNDYTLARRLHEQCVSALALAPYTDPIFLLDVYSNLASDLVELGETGQAIVLYERALEPYQAVPLGSLSQAERYLQTSLSYTAVKQWSMAQVFAQRSLALYQMREEQKLVGLTHQCLGKALEREQQLDAAEREYRLGLELVEGLDAAAAALCYTSLAEVALLRLRLEEAEGHAQRALHIAEAARDEQGQGQALFAWALIGAARLAGEGTVSAPGAYTEIDQRFERALGLLERSGVPEIAAREYERYASVLRVRGEVGQALKATEQARFLRGRTGSSR